MPTVYCRGCGKEIDEAASFCPGCGAPQGAAQQSANTVQDSAPTAVKSKARYATYAEVPWYRRNWFAILCALIFSPGLLFILFTGTVYYERKGELRSYGLGAKIFLIVWCLAWLAWAIMGSFGPDARDPTAAFNSCVNQYGLVPDEATDGLKDCLVSFFKTNDPREHLEILLKKTDYNRLDSSEAKLLYSRLVLNMMQRLHDVTLDTLTREIAASKLPNGSRRATKK
ncbi:MAG: zinc ribbon domain-containing protein [Candidatus Accumulibacter sp.]|jgi:hypothetical protein|nr:zinc ribbon domain-containing protein [Accumulibacter sp.]